MKYTPEEVAKLLANRPNQQHYIEAMIRKCIDEAIRPSAEVVLARGWYHFRKGEDGAADDYDLYDFASSPCADCIPVKIVRADSPSPSDEAVRRDAELALDLLETLFSEWEEGTPCYESEDGEGAFLGNAFRLDDETFKGCVDLLTRRRPRAAIEAEGKA